MKILILLIGLLSCSTPDIIDNKENTNVNYNFQEKEIQIYENINSYRESLGLSTLILDSYLSVKCKEHNETMISLGYLTHSGFEYRSNQIKSSFPTTKVGECLSKEYDNPLHGWLNSPPHKTMIETEDYNYIGVSFIEGYCTIIMVK